MKNSRRVGLDLRSSEERATVRAAARACGLEPFDLPLPEERAVGAAAGGQAALLIVTDRAAVARKVEDAQTAEALGAGERPLVVLVRSAEDLPGDAPAEGGSDWVLERPLRQESVSPQLGQAARVSRFFAERHRGMAEELRRTRRVFDSVSNGISICDARLQDLPLIYVNQGFERMTGYSAREVEGRNCRFLQGGDTDQPDLNKIREAIRERREVRVVLKNYRKDGTLFWNELYMSPMVDSEGTLTHFVGIQNDVTAQVESERRLSYLANHDALTGLANRGLLFEQLAQGIGRARRRGGSLAVLFFDLDNFKHVNDVYGHEAGDSLLRVVAERLRLGVREHETVARLGGDEFVVVLEELSKERTAGEVMERLTRRIGEPIFLREHKFCPSASVGAAIYPDDGQAGETLLKVADFNMYLAKHRARSESECVEEDGASEE